VRITRGVKKEKESKLVPLAVIIVALAGLLISIVAARASFLFIFIMGLLSLSFSPFLLFSYTGF